MSVCVRERERVMMYSYVFLIYFYAFFNLFFIFHIKVTPIQSLFPYSTLTSHTFSLHDFFLFFRFNEKAAERHIPVCTNIRAKPTMLKRGLGGGGGVNGTVAATKNNSTVGGSGSGSGGGNRRGRM